MSATGEGRECTVFKGLIAHPRSLLSPSRSCPPLRPSPTASVPPLSYIPGYDTCKSWSEDANCADPSKSVKIQKCTISYDVRMKMQQEQSQRQEGTGAAEIAIVAPLFARPARCERAATVASAQPSHKIFHPCAVRSCFRCDRASRVSSCMPNSVATSLVRAAPLPPVTRSHR